ncbi:MAG: ATP-binding protein [Candidatus Hydrothermales bacterium]
MNLLNLLSQAKSINDLIGNLKIYLEETLSSEVNLIDTEKIKDILNVADLKKILIDKEKVIKNEKVYIPLKDEEKIYTIISFQKKESEKIEEIENILTLTSVFLKNYRLFEDAKNEIFKLNFLFNFHRSLESQIKENIENSLKELSYLLNLKGLYFKSKNLLIKIGSLDKLDDEKLYKTLPSFETKGEYLEFDELKLFCFLKEKTILLAEKEYLFEDEREFLISILELTEEWYEEKLPVSYELLDKVIHLELNDSLKFLKNFLNEKFNLKECEIYIKEDEKYKSIAERINFEEREDLNFYKLKGRQGEYLISFTGEKKEIPLNLLSIILDLLTIKRKNEELDKLKRVLIRIMEVITHIENIDEILYHVCFIIKEELDIVYAGFLLREEEDYLRMKVGIGYEDYEKLLKRKLKIGLEGLSGFAAHTKEIVYSPDVSKDARYIPASPIVKSEVALPMIVDNKVIGVMIISSPKIDGFSKEDIETFEKISKFASYFLKYRKIIDELKKNLSSLKEEEEFIDVILKNIPIGIIYAERDLYIKRVNYAAIYTLKLKEEEIKGTILCKIFEEHEPGDPNCIFKKSLEERIPLVKRNVEVKKGEEVLPLSLSSTFIYEKEKIKGLILMIEDIKEVVALEEQLRRSERLSAIGRIAAHMAHEIKNPLASISVGIEYIYSSLEEDDPKKKHLGVILKEISRLDRLIKNLLSFARRPPLKRKRVNLRDMIEELAIFFGQELKEKKIELDLSLPEYDTIAFVDEDQMKEVMENLIRNAIEAMPDGGKLAISLGEKKGGTIFITVEDTGVGVEPSELAHIFEPFYTTKKGGSGLGLSIVHRILEDHGAKINVESEKGKGTKFLIDLPK